VKRAGRAGSGTAFCAKPVSEVTSFTTANLLRRRATYGAGLGSERYSITEIDPTGTKAALPMQIPYGISGDLFLRGSLRLICGAQNEVCSEVGRKR
jgi:hypothetical protein